MAQIMWRLVEDATLDTLNDRSRGQYDIRLTRDPAFERFFDGLSRTGVTALGGFTISVPIEAAPGPPPISAQALRVRYMGPKSRRCDWYIPSQRSSTAYPLWRPGVGFDPATTNPDTDYVLLIRDDSGRFHARWLKGADAEALPAALRAQMSREAVGIADVVDRDWHALERQFDIPPAGQVAEVHAYRRDELILVLDRFTSQEGAIDEVELEELSDELGRVQATADGGSEGPVDVAAYVQSFSDLAAGQDVAVPAEISDVWSEYRDDTERLRATADAIRSNLENPEASEVVFDITITEAPEGRILTALHVRRERSRELRRSKIAALGAQPSCEVCGFDFLATYGERGRGFIECHHLVPVRDLQPESVTTLDDLALLCANCHRMIHARRPWLSIDELRVLLG